MARREWSDNEKATALAALDANGGNVAKTARELGMSSKTLQHWSQGRGVQPAVLQLEDEKKEALADVFEGIARKLVKGIGVWIDCHENEGCNPASVGTALGIVVDKMQLLRGDPTSIQKNETVLTAEERAQRAQDLLERGRDRAGVPASHAGRASRTRPTPVAN